MQSIEHDAPTPPDELLDRIEGEIHRLRERRPALSDRLDRAAGILVQHLSCPRQRVIRVRLREGQVRFLVKGSGGAVYVVNTTDWSCSCPDAHRRGKGCKHGLASFVMWRTAQPRRVPRVRTCAGCSGRFPAGEMVEVMEEHESLTFFVGDPICASCALAHGVL